MKNVPLYEVRTINDLRDMIKQSAAIYKDKAAFLIKDPRASRQQLPENVSQDASGERSLPYMPVSYIQYDRDVDALGTRFKKLGLESARVAILAETRYEWYVTYMATVNGVGVIVPLDKE